MHTSEVVFQESSMLWNTQFQYMELTVPIGGTLGSRPRNTPSRYLGMYRLLRCEVLSRIYRTKEYAVLVALFCDFFGGDE